MKAITLWQPWASFMFANLPYPPKTIETRTQQRRHRGPLAIHAGKREPAWVRRMFSEDRDLSDLMLEYLGVTDVGDLPHGCVLGVVKMVSCVPTDSIRDELSRTERLLGDYDTDRAAIITADPSRLVSPVPWRGRQGWWNLPDDALDGREFVLADGVARWGGGR